MTSLTNLIDKILKINRKDSEKVIPKLSKAEAKKLLVDYIMPELHQKGFIYQKNGLFWRICDNKTDVIELHFLLDSKPKTLNLPLSTFSILGGCYYNFMPNVYSEKIIQQIPNLVTPYETHCHLRFTAKPNLQQPIFKKNDYLWHLDCNEIERSEVLKDVRVALETQLMPLMSKFDDMNELLSLLQSQNQVGLDMGIGKPDSFNRQYLIGFTYLKLQNKKFALQNLSKAKNLLDELLIKVKEPMGLKSEAPIIKQSRIISETIDSLS